MENCKPDEIYNKNPGSDTWAATKKPQRVLSGKPTW